MGSGSDPVTCVPPARHPATPGQGEPRRTEPGLVPAICTEPPGPPAPSQGKRACPQKAERTQLRRELTGELRPPPEENIEAAHGALASQTVFKGSFLRGWMNCTARREGKAVPVHKRRSGSEPTGPGRSAGCRPQAGGLRPGTVSLGRASTLTETPLAQVQGKTSFFKDFPRDLVCKVMKQHLLPGLQTTLQFNKTPSTQGRFLTSHSAGQTHRM